MADDGFQVPAIISETVAWLREKGLNAEGIFRIPGNLSVMKRLKARYEAGETGIVASQRDEHDVAGLLKLHFREMRTWLRVCLCVCWAHASRLSCCACRKAALPCPVLPASAGSTGLHGP